MLTFRVDDFPLTKPEESWRHNVESYKKFDEVMRRYLSGYTLGVIPSKIFQPERELLSNLSHVDLALHGVYHDERYPNEFREWQTIHEVIHTLSSAKAILDEIGGPVDTYIPPHNVIDTKTVQALYMTGFKKIWGGPGTREDVFHYASKIYGMEAVYFEPPYFYGRSDEMVERGAVQKIRELLAKNEEEQVPVHIGLHWTWEVNIGLDHLDGFLKAITEEV